jgi:hypothetical protein
MSLTTFKKKSVINYGSKRSGIPPGGYWLPQGPFGHATDKLNLAITNFGPVGFSINGGHRNIGGVGRDMKMSKSGTPYRGTYPVGWGGTYGTYPSGTLVGSNNDGIQSTGVEPNEGSKVAAVDPVLNSRIVDTMGTQYLYIKPSVLSTSGMLDKKYKWIKNGQYPNNWVQPLYTGNQVGTSSQLLYIQNKASANTCNIKVNSADIYENHAVPCGSTLCRKGRSTAKFTYNDMVRNAPYSKNLKQPVSYDQLNSFLTRKCNNPIGSQKPFPYAVNTGSGQFASGTSITSFANACNTTQNVYLEPPEWYTSK